MAETDVIRTPDQRVRVFVSSTLRELAAERRAVLLSERFEMSQAPDGAAGDAPLAGALPALATPLLGREREAAAVEDLVAGEGRGW
jgi:hypothetical protein